MKNMKKIFALVLAMMLVFASVAALANEQSAHTITITNSDQNVTHSYEAYQVFVGKLDAGQTKLSDIEWGSGVDGDAILAALQASSEFESGDPAKNEFADCTTAADVAEVLGSYRSTSGANEAAGKIDSVALIISQHLKTVKKEFTPNGTNYTAEVIGDGYYFIKDTTTTLTSTTGSDTKSKFLLAVVKDTTIVAKDTHMTPDKEIVDGDNLRVKADSAAVGDTVNFEVKIPVPNTKKYIDHFIFDMQDKLPAGLTFTGITSIAVGDLVDDAEHAGQKILEATPDWTLASTDYDLKVKTGSGEFGAFTAPSDPKTATGGQQIKVIFKDFKAKVEGAYSDPKGDELIGKTLVVKYTAVVNKDADFTSTGNENEVYFDYSNDPNHDYDGDEPGPNEPMGETPRDKTKTLLINIEITKTGEGADASALAGAVFEITGTTFTTTLVSGEKYVAYTGTRPTAGEGETVEEGVYYKLKDGSYTTEAYTTEKASFYEDNTTYAKVTYQKAVVTPTGSTKTVTVTSDKNGKIKLEGLNAGVYTIKEIQAPTGYNLDQTVHTINVTWDKASKKFVLVTANPNKSDDNVTFDESTATAAISIVNHSGSTLPSTGGIGTTLFYVGGGILVVLAAILLITKRRMGAED